MVQRRGRSLAASSNTRARAFHGKYAAAHYPMKSTDLLASSPIPPSLLKEQASADIRKYCQSYENARSLAHGLHHDAASQFPGQQYGSVKIQQPFSGWPQ